MKFANLKEFKGRQFRVVNSFTEKPISTNIGDFDEAYRELEDFISAQGCHEDCVELQEVL